MVQGAITIAHVASITSPARHERAIHASGRSSSGTRKSASPRARAASPSAPPNQAASASERVRTKRSASHSEAAISAA
jgi:hypothetical protein